MEDAILSQSGMQIPLKQKSGTRLKTEKRSKIELYYEILQIFYVESKKNGKSTPSFTRTASQVNMPYNRFKQALSELDKLNLIELYDMKLLITDKGLEFLIEFSVFKDYLKEIGFMQR